MAKRISRGYYRHHGWRILKRVNDWCCWREHIGASALAVAAAGFKTKRKAALWIEDQQAK